MKKTFGLNCMSRTPCCVSFLRGKPLAKNIFFKSSEVLNLKSILPEREYFEFMIRFLISPKKCKIRFWIQESFSGFSQKNTPHRDL